MQILSKKIKQIQKKTKTKTERYFISLLNFMSNHISLIQFILYIKLFFFKQQQQTYWQFVNKFIRNISQQLKQMQLASQNNQVFIEKQPEHIDQKANSQHNQQEFSHEKQSKTIQIQNQQLKQIQSLTPQIYDQEKQKSQQKNKQPQFQQIKNNKDESLCSQNEQIKNKFQIQSRLRQEQNQNQNQNRTPQIQTKQQNEADNQQEQHTEVFLKKQQNQQDQNGYQKNCNDKLENKVQIQQHQVNVNINVNAQVQVQHFEERELQQQKTETPLKKRKKLNKVVLTQSEQANTNTNIQNHLQNQPEEDKKMNQLDNDNEVEQNQNQGSNISHQIQENNVIKIDTVYNKDKDKDNQEVYQKQKQKQSEKIVSNKQNNEILIQKKDQLEEKQQKEVQNEKVFQKQKQLNSQKQVQFQEYKQETQEKFQNIKKNQMEIDVLKEQNQQEEEGKNDQGQGQCQLKNKKDEPDLQQPQKNQQKQQQKQIFISEQQKKQQFIDIDNQQHYHHHVEINEEKQNIIKTINQNEENEKSYNFIQEVQQKSRISQEEQKEEQLQLQQQEINQNREDKNQSLIQNVFQVKKQYFQEDEQQQTQNQKQKQGMLLNNENRQCNQINIQNAQNEKQSKDQSFIQLTIQKNIQKKQNKTQIKNGQNGYNGQNIKKVSAFNQTSRRKLNIVHDKSVHQLVIDLHKSQSNRQQIPKHRPSHFPKTNKEAPNLDRLVHNISLQSNIMNISVGQIFQNNKRKSDDMQTILKEQIQMLKKQIAFYEERSAQQNSRITSQDQHYSRLQNSSKGSKFYEKRQNFRQKQYGKIVKRSQMQNQSFYIEGINNRQSRFVQNEKYQGELREEQQINQNNNNQPKSNSFRIKKQSSQVKNSQDRKSIGSIVDLRYNQTKSEVTIGQIHLTNQKITVQDFEDRGDQVLQNKFSNKIKNQEVQIKQKQQSKNVKNYQKIIQITSFDKLSIFNLLQKLNQNLQISIDQFITAEASQQSLVQMAKRCFYNFGIDIEDPDYLLNIKKYKNCVSFNLNPDDNIIWHYDGKFYFGGWKTQNLSHQSSKNGWGYQISPQKYIYKGQFVENRRNGFGLIKINKSKQQENSQNKTKKGDVYYFGNWFKGNRNGYGVQIQINQNYIIQYRGEWIDNKKSGHGSLKILQKNENNEYSELQSYEGDFMNGHKQGLGKQVYLNGDSYYGNYHHNKFHGEGKYIWSNGSNYAGEFQFGMRSGHGIWKSPIIEQQFETYEGSYSNDKKNGYGVYKWKNGTIYEGQFKNDLKHGQGNLIYEGNKKVKHLWQNGQIVQKNNLFKVKQNPQKQLSQSRNASFHKSNTSSSANKSNTNKRPLTSNKPGNQIKAKINQGFSFKNKSIDIQNMQKVDDKHQVGHIVHQINFRHKSIKQKQTAIMRKNQAEENPQKIKLNKQVVRNLHPHPNYNTQMNRTVK